MATMTKARTARGPRSRVRVGLALGLGATAAMAGAVSPGVVLLIEPAALTGDAVLIAVAVLAMAGVGTLIAIRVPSNGVGWLLLVAAWLLGVEFLALDYGAASGILAGGTWPGTAVAIWLYGNLLAIPVLIMVIGIPLVYPDGRLVSPRWRWLVAFLLLTGANVVLKSFRVGPIADTNVPNPFGTTAVEPLIGLLELPPLQVLGLPLVFGGAIASMAIRFRRGDPVERAQLKWLLVVTVVAVTGWLLVAVGTAVGASVVTTLGWITGLTAFIALPVAIGIAILKYRLFEIDRIISRTIGWTIVTGVLVSILVGGVLVLQAMLAGVTQGNTLAVAASTLAVAAVAQPLRLRVQRTVDRRFDRARYDAERTVGAFTDRLRGEVALDAVLADLEDVIAVSIQPSSCGMWLRQGPFGRTSAEAGATLQQ
jgi:hypothetical protein